MFYQQSPLETLAPYAVTFVAAALSMGEVVLYGRWIQRRGAKCSAATEVAP